MEKVNLGKKILSQLLVMIMFAGCVASDVGSVQKSNVGTGGTTGTTGGGTVTNGAGSGDGGIGGGTSLAPTVEIRHLIEPNLTTIENGYSTGTGQASGGSYVRKLTIPKNYGGRLYLGGINIGTLADRHVRVRFKFGMGLEPVTISATVTQAPGITPSTEVSVLVMDLRSQPFRDLRLFYDLFDYNDYDFAAGNVPTQDNRNSGLYCRGLSLQHDSTFTGVGACDAADEQCLYSYAKVVDQGLVQLSGSTKVPLSPSLSQVKTSAGGSYYKDFMTYQLRKPLLDTVPTIASNMLGSVRFSLPKDVSNNTDAIDAIFEDKAAVPPSTPAKSVWDPIQILGNYYYYRGPYRLTDKNNWQLAYARLDGHKRLFRENSWVDYPRYAIDPLADDNAYYPTQDRLYYNSYLFPLATQIELQANVPHLASSTVLGTRTEQSLPTASKTVWMDGANARANSRNTSLEHVGSCNVSATIEILAKDNNGVDYIIAEANDVKLQLVRPTTIKTDSNNDVLYSNYKSCVSNSSCGGTECCFNNRCWDETLVSQCFDSSSTEGNRNIGEACTTDLQCSSLCCNSSTGQCSPHNTANGSSVLCSKPVGQSCIAKEWCAKSTVTKCLVIKTGTDASGNVTCRQQCYQVQEYGDCTNGICTPPVQESIPSFDPSAPGACNNAVTAPSF